MLSSALRPQLFSAYRHTALVVTRHFVVGGILRLRSAMRASTVATVRVLVVIGALEHAQLGRWRQSAMIDWWVRGRVSRACLLADGAPTA